LVKTWLLAATPAAAAAAIVEPACTAIMSASAKITCASAKARALEVLAEPLAAGALVGCTGITTFIKTELVADGADKPHVIPPKGGFPKRGASQKGLAAGRKFDTAFQVAVAGGGSTPAVARAMRLLASAGVVVIKCQQRVATDGNKLTTMIDAVGIATAPPFAVVCIELKTCQLKASAYTAYSNLVCRRTPMLRCNLANTERNRYSLQAAYGALALSARLGCSTRAMVVVSCADNTVVYDVAPAFVSMHLFTRLTPVMAMRAQPVAKGSPRQFDNTLALMAAWPPTGADTLQRAGLIKAKKQVGRRVWSAAGSDNVLSALFIHVPRWRALRKSQRDSLATKMKLAAGRCGAAGTMLRLYVFTTFVPGTAPVLLPVGAPFLVQ
jgi:hypothetical protein